MFMKGRFSFMDIELFDYDLPEELIAQTPLKKRDTSRLMVLDKETGDVEHKHFYEEKKVRPTFCRSIDA